MHLIYTADAMQTATFPSYCREHTLHLTPTVSFEALIWMHLAHDCIVPSVLKASEEPIKNAIETITSLAQAASKQPYYKFNHMWSRQVQDVVRIVGATNQTIH